MSTPEKPRKPSVGFYTYTCCEGCGFTLLFIEGILPLLEKYEVVHFNLLKEKNLDSELDLAFVEGAITTTAEIRELKGVRERSKFVVAMGACACNGGVPAMRNFVGSSSLRKYVYHHKIHPKSVPAAGVGEHVHVDYYLRGCPIIKTELVLLLKGFLEGQVPEPFAGPVCTECPRKGADCFLKHKVECLGAITHGGCGALCTSDDIPCMLCRGPTDRANIAGEIKLFEKFGLDEREIHARLNLFKNIEEKI